ncbi:MAG: ParB/RepB/Spo0J family partition protein [Desulfitobacteriaceae bacterium]
MSKKGLGRGLEALIGNSGSSGLEVREISLTDIEPNPSQPRKEFDRESLEQLAESLKVHGLLQPIIVTATVGRYHIIAGERRFRAAQLAGLDKIACLVQECSEREMAERALVENLQRADLSPIEEGRAYARLIEEYDLTQEEVASRVGKARTTIANLLRVIQLPMPVLELIQGGKLSLGHAKVLVGLADTSLQVLIGQKAAVSSLSVREMEDLIRKREENEGEKRTRKKVDGDLQYLEDRLRSSLQTKVRLKGTALRGKIEIEYFSEEELNRLLDLWKIEVE